MDKVIEIAKYLEITELACRNCGTVAPLEEINIKPTAFNSGNVKYKAVCPECHYFIQWMPEKKIERVFFKGSMHQIAELETGLLQWMMKMPHYSNPVKLFVAQALRGRIDNYQVPDIEADRAEEHKLDLIKKLKMERERKIGLIQDEQKTIIDNWNVDDAPRMEHYRKNIVKWQNRVAFIDKKLAKLVPEVPFVDPNQLSIE